MSDETHAKRQSGGPPLGALIRQAQQALRRALDAALRDLGVTTPQFSVLNVLADRPGISGAELARASMLTPQTVNGILVALERSGAIVRRPHAGDSRVLCSELTPTGQALLATALTRVDAVERTMTASLSAAQVDELRRHLAVCTAALTTHR